MGYLDDAGRVPLLTPEEEIILGRAVQSMQQLLETNPDGPYTRQERGVIVRGRRARERMTTANMRLVGVISAKYMRRCDHLTQDDLMQEGTFGLIRAVEKFDPERGYRFSTYAYWWIRQAMNRAVTTHDRAIRVPVHVAERIVKLRAWISQRMELHGTPTLDECAAFLDVDREAIRTYLQHLHGAISLDGKVRGTETESSSLIDLIQDDGPDLWDQVEMTQRHEQLLKAVAKLDESQREVIQLRLSDDFFSQKDQYRRLGISRQAYQQREARVMNLLRVKLCA